MSLPIACTLTNAELQERRREVLQKARRAVTEVKELENGCAYRFPTDEKWLTELTSLVNLERQCCPFLRFVITVEAEDGPTWLEMTGPEGAKEFLSDTFA
jgi:hypothetical protein